jgi:predicted ATPase
MIKLQQIQLKGFKSIRNINLELKHLNLLIGPNGVGKSNFISFFRFMNKLLQKDLQFFVAQQGGVDRFLHFGRHVTEIIEIQLLFNKSNSYICTLVPDQSGRFIFKNEYYQEDNLKTSLANIGDKESNSIVSNVAAYLSDWQVYHFHDTSDTAKIKQSCIIHDNERLRPQAENLAAFLYSIQDSFDIRK